MCVCVWIYKKKRGIYIYIYIYIYLHTHIYIPVMVSLAPGEIRPTVGLTKNERGAVVFILKITEESVTFVTVMLPQLSLFCSGATAEGREIRCMMSMSMGMLM